MAAAATAGVAATLAIGLGLGLGLTGSLAALVVARTIVLQSNQETSRQKTCGRLIDYIS